MTLRELVWLAEARGNHDWEQTAAVLAMLANAHRDPKKRPTPFKPSDFNPFAVERAEKPKVILKDLRILKRFFVDPHAGRKGSGNG